MSSNLPKIPIPDLRFESTFRKSLEQASLKSNSTKLTKDFQPEITFSIILQVILKDVIIVPLLQGFALSALLLVTKPLLWKVARNGRAYGLYLTRSLGLVYKGQYRRV